MQSLGLKTKCVSIKFGLKVFMDAYWLVTPEDGDRYPVGPPYIILFPVSSAAEQLTVNQLVPGSIPGWGAKYSECSTAW